MKNKIRCLFDKFKSEDLHGIFGICICALLIFTMVFAPLSVSAYEPSYSVTFRSNGQPYDAFGIYYNNGSNTSAESELGKYYPVDVIPSIYIDIITNQSGSSQKTVLFDEGSYSVNTLLPDGRYYVFYGFSFGVDTADRIAVVFNNDDHVLSLDNAAVSLDVTKGESTVFTTLVPTTVDLITVSSGLFVPNLTYYVLIPEDEYGVPDSGGGGIPTDCPTLEEQISNYTGTWTDFLMLLRQNNRTLADSYQNNIDLAIQSGYQSGANSVTLEQRLSEFDGDWQDFERLMAEYNVDLQTMYTYYINSLETQSFEDGKDYGQEVGYKEGYNSGLNKGQSDTFTKNFFTDFLGGVVEALDSIHLYEHIRQIDGGVSTVVEWYISPWSIFTSMICLIVVIIILKVWLGG